MKNNDKTYMVGRISLRPGWAINLTWDMDQERKNVIKNWAIHNTTALIYTHNNRHKNNDIDN
jgi:hypothetical protein